MIAQDVKKAFPELVKNNNGVLSVNYLGMIGPLVEAVKELDIKNNELSAQNSALRIELEAKDRELERMFHEISDRMDVIEGKRRPPLNPYNQ